MQLKVFPRLVKSVVDGTSRHLPPIKVDVHLMEAAKCLLIIAQHYSGSAYQESASALAAAAAAAAAAAVQFR